MQRLIPEPAPTTVAEQLAEFRPRELAGSERPYVFTNFAITLDGQATIDEVSGKIGSETDTAMLIALRSCSDAVLVGAGTIRAENYGRLLPGEQARCDRQAAGLAPEPLAALVSNRLELPWDAGLFSSGAGEIVVFTAAAADPPATETPLEVVRHPDRVDLGAALSWLRRERRVEALLCEGGPSLHADLLAAGLVDELFVTLAAKLAGGEGPRMVEGEIGEARELELRWLLSEGAELFARYALA